MTAKTLLRAILPSPVRRWLRNQRWRAGRSLVARRTTPASADWGWSRGRPVDRCYIEKHLADHAGDVPGHVLDFADDTDARRFGDTQVTQVDMLHDTADNPHTTIVADLAHRRQIFSDTFDRVLGTQVLMLTYDVRAAIRTLYRILRPGGTVLVTVPGVAHKISRTEEEDYWRFTVLSLRPLFEEVFPKGQAEVRAYGNVLAATAFLYGFAAEDLRRDDLECYDPDYEVTTALRPGKPPGVSAPGQPSRRGRSMPTG